MHLLLGLQEVHHQQLGFEACLPAFKATKGYTSGDGADEGDSNQDGSVLARLCAVGRIERLQCGYDAKWLEPQKWLEETNPCTFLMSTKESQVKHHNRVVDVWCGGVSKGCRKAQGRQQRIGLGWDQPQSTAKPLSRGIRERDQGKKIGELLCQARYGIARGARTLGPEVLRCWGCGPTRIILRGKQL